MTGWYRPHHTASVLTTHTRCYTCVRKWDFSWTWRNHTWFLHNISYFSITSSIWQDTGYFHHQEESTKFVRYPREQRTNSQDLASPPGIVSVSWEDGTSGTPLLQRTTILSGRTVEFQPKLCSQIHPSKSRFSERTNMVDVSPQCVSGFSGNQSKNPCQHLHRCIECGLGHSLELRDNARNQVRSPFYISTFWNYRRFI